jgi:hypothetical protein
MDDLEGDQEMKKIIFILALLLAACASKVDNFAARYGTVYIQPTDVQHFFVFGMKIYSNSYDNVVECVVVPLSSYWVIDVKNFRYEAGWRLVRNNDCVGYARP